MQIQPARLNTVHSSGDPTLLLKQIRDLSATRYGWYPFKDIDFRGPLGVERLSGHAYIERSALVPFVNLEYMAPADGDQMTLGGGPPRLIPKEKYAGVIMAEMLSSYEHTGMVDLSPITGMNAADAFQIFSIVQPYAYPLSRLEHQLGVEAEKRILASDLSERDQWKADECRILMLQGAMRAITFATTMRDDLARDMAAYVGSKQGQSHPDKLHLHIYEQLEETPPSKISVTPSVAPTNARLEELLVLLAEARVAENAPHASADMKLTSEQAEEVGRLNRELDSVKELLAGLMASRDTTVSSRQKGSRSEAA